RSPTQQLSRSPVEHFDPVPRLGAVRADDECAGRCSGAHGAHDACMGRAEVESTNRLEISQAGIDLLPDPMFSKAFVLDEQAASGLAVLRPTDARPDLFSGDAGSLFGVDRVEPVSPSASFGEPT